MLTPGELRRALLDLGMEDWIALPEIRGSYELRGLADAFDEIGEIADALVALLKEGQIQVLNGHWSGEPKVVSVSEGEAILRRREQYEFNSADDLESRAYYANIDNLRL